MNTLLLALALSAAPAFASDGLVQLMIEMSTWRQGQPCSSGLVKSAPTVLESSFAGVAAEEGIKRALELQKDVGPFAEKLALDGAEKSFLLKEGEILPFLLALDQMALGASGGKDWKGFALRLVGFLAVGGGLVTAFVAADSAAWSVQMSQVDFDPFRALFGGERPKPDLSAQNAWAMGGVLSALGGTITYWVGYLFHESGNAQWHPFLGAVKAGTQEPLHFEIQSKESALKMVFYSDEQTKKAKLAVFVR